MRVIVNPKYTHLQKQIEEIPKFFADEGKVVYDGRNILKRISLDNVDVVVKSFKKPHIINRVVYSYFRQSKAARSYIYSMELQKHGIIIQSFSSQLSGTDCHDRTISERSSYKQLLCLLL